MATATGTPLVAGKPETPTGPRSDAKPDSELSAPTKPGPASPASSKAGPPKPGPAGPAPSKEMPAETEAVTATIGGAAESDPSTAPTAPGAGAPRPRKRP